MTPEHGAGRTYYWCALPRLGRPRHCSHRPYIPQTHFKNISNEMQVPKVAQGGDPRRCARGGAQVDLYAE